MDPTRYDINKEGLCNEFLKVQNHYPKKIIDAYRIEKNGYIERRSKTRTVNMDFHLSIRKM